MKKLTKRMWTVVLTVVMLLAMAVPTMAAGIGTITINGAIKDATYAAYKIFDVTYSGDNYATYTIPVGSTIASISGFSEIFETTSNGGETYVSIKNGVEETTIMEWFKTNESAILNIYDKKAQVTNTDGEATVTLKTGEAGYYYVKSTTGEVSAMSIDTAHPVMVANSKISDNPVIPDEGGKKVNDKTVGTMDIGETAVCTFTFNATNYNVKDANATQIKSYTVTDTLDGFSISDDQLDGLIVKVGDVVLTSSESTDPYFKATKIDGGLKIVINNYDRGNYKSPSTVVVSYDATYTDGSTGEASTNKSELSWSDGENSTSVGSSTATIYSYTIKINNYEKDSSTTKLSGAKFILKTSNDEEAKYYNYNYNYGVSWNIDQAYATELTTDENGTVMFTGLKAGTYYLVETKAAAGYNLLKDPIKVELAEITEQTSADGLTSTVDVANTGGTLFPSTGSIGTTMIYTLGAIFAVGASVVLITRKRMSVKLFK